MLPLFELPTAALAAVILAATVGATALGAWAGHRSRHLSEHLSEPLGVLQGALLGVVGLILAFGLSLALSRYEDRRATVVDEANMIGTAWLRAQMLEPGVRGPSLTILDRYAAQAVDVADRQPGSDAERAAAANEEELQGQLWKLARRAVAEQPVATGPRLYTETLNDMFDAQATRQAALANRVPNAVLILEVVGAAVALALLGAYLAMIGRGGGAVFVISGLVAFLLFVIADLDRPTRGMIKVPDTPLANQYRAMKGPQAPG